MGDDCSYRRAADDVVSVDVAAVNAVVEIVGGAMVVDRSDIVGNMHVPVIVVVVGVYIGGVRDSVSGVRSVASGMTARGRLAAVVHIIVTFCAGAVYRLGLCLTLCRVAALCRGVGRNRGA